MLILGAGFIALVVALFGATVPETRARAERRMRGATEAIEALAEIRQAQDFYRLTRGMYGNWLSVSDSMRAENRRWEKMEKFDFRASDDGRACFAAERRYDYDVSCAMVVREGPETAAARALPTGSWQLVPDGPIRCRKTGFPWQWLHGAGAGYIDPPAIPAAPPTLPAAPAPNP